LAAYATCKFPLVDKWKEAADNNNGLGFIDSLLSGYGQIAFCDNPVTGILFIMGCFYGSVQHGVSSLVAAIVATLVAYIIGVPRLSIRLGLYTFNAALAGLGIALFVFPGQGITWQLLLYSSIGGVLCVFLTAGFAGFLSKFNVPALALPYCVVLLILIPASLRLNNLSVTTSVLPYLTEMSSSHHVTWTVGEFFTAVFNNFAEVLWQANVVTGVFFLLGVLASSRIDGLSAIIASVASTMFAIFLELPKDGILIGLYGYNALLLMMVLFGRGYAMSIKSFFFSIVLALFTVIAVAWMATIFAPPGAPVAAFPYVLMAIFALAGRDAFKGLIFIEPLKWGVPETIAAELKKQAC